VLKSYEVYVYAYLEGYPEVSVYSNKITINVVCGNEEISESQTLFYLPQVYPR
jgi:hypothetical protein